MPTFMAVSPQRLVQSTGLAPRQLDLLLGGRDDLLGRKAVLLLKLLERRRGAERAHADHVAVAADVALPTKSRGLFHGNSRTHGGRKDLLAIPRMLAAVVLKDLPGRHAHHAGRNAL